MLGSDKRPPHSSPILPQFFQKPRSFPTFPENLSVGKISRPGPRLQGSESAEDPCAHQNWPGATLPPRGDNKRDAQARREAPVTFVEGDEGGERGEEVGNGEKVPIRESTGCRALSRGAGHRGRLATQERLCPTAGLCLVDGGKERVERAWGLENGHTDVCADHGCVAGFGGEDASGGERYVEVDVRLVYTTGGEEDV